MYFLPKNYTKNNFKSTDTKKTCLFLSAGLVGDGRSGLIPYSFPSTLPIPLLSLPIAFVLLPIREYPAAVSSSVFLLSVKLHYVTKLLLERAHLHYYPTCFQVEITWGLKTQHAHNKLYLHVAF